MQTPKKRVMPHNFIIMTHGSIGTTIHHTTTHIILGHGHHITIAIIIHHITITGERQKNPEKNHNSNNKKNYLLMKLKKKLKD